MGVIHMKIYVKEIEAKIKEFQKIIEDADNPYDLVQAKRLLEKYLSAIEKKIWDIPLSSMSRKLIENEHKITYKYD